MSTFRAIWPIVDTAVDYQHLIREACEDLPTLAARAHAEITGRGRFSIAPSARVPGSGRVTESVLLYEAPAVEVGRRDYWKVAS